jgi:hypothetical protein
MASSGVRAFCTLMSCRLTAALCRSVSTMDPPEHGRYRKIFQKAFLPQTVAKWGESVVDPDDARAIAGRKVPVFLLDRLCHHRPIEQTESAEGSVETLNPSRHQRAGGRTVGDDRVDPGGVSQLIEKRITRYLDRVRNTQPPMAASLLPNPASEKMIAVGDTAAAIEAAYRMAIYAVTWSSKM